MSMSEMLESIAILPAMISRMTDLKKALAEHKASEPHGSGWGEYIHDVVYGANDGIVTTFAVVSGANGAQLAPYVVVIMGFANVLADALSMGLGNYLSIRSKRDNYQRVRKEEMQEIETIPEIECEEIREIYAAKGFQGADLETVTRVITADKAVWADTMMREEHGLAPEDTDHAILHGVVTFCSFIVFGSLPILPYVLPIAEESRFSVTIASAAFALLLVGLLRSYVTRERIFRGPLEILSIGALCAAAAYFVGVMLRGFAGGGF